MIIKDETVDIPTALGPMRTYTYMPAEGGKFPGLVFYSEIFQQTGPIKRLAAFLAGHGFVVAVPEIFHELNPIGTVLAYDQAGADKGNQDKISKTLESYDEDARLAAEFLAGHPACDGKLGAIGICIGGHLAFRAAMLPSIRATACFYATDIHKRSLGKGMNDNSLDRIPEIKGELMMVWGRQDPHIPQEGRMQIYEALSKADRKFTWHEFNGAHAFLRDEGARYDAEHFRHATGMAIDLFRRCCR